MRDRGGRRRRGEQARTPLAQPAMHREGTVTGFSKGV